MTLIRDVNTVIGMLERGAGIRELNRVFAETLAALNEEAGHNPKKKIGGKVVLTIGIELVNGTATINAEIAAKTPKAAPFSSLFWLTDDGELSTEHPKQPDMFKPREAETA